MKPSDLMTDEEWDALLNRYSTECGMAVALTDASGAILRESGKRFPLCAKIRENDTALSFICSQTNTAMLQTVRTTLAPEIDLCEAGLVRVVIPIVREGALVGQIAACGKASQDEEFDPFLAAQTLEVDEEEVLGYFEGTPTCTADDMKAAAKRLFDELSG